VWLRVHAHGILFILALHAGPGLCSHGTKGLEKPKPAKQELKCKKKKEKHGPQHDILSLSLSDVLFFLVSPFP
jgi:hypothetical protein